MNKLIIIGGCLVLTLVLGLTLVWPKYQNIQVLRSNIEVKEAELENKTDYFAQIKETSEKAGEYEENLAKISSALPQSAALSSLFNFLQLATAQTGLLLEKISLVGVTDSEEIEEIKETRVSLEISGAYSAFKNFLTALENSSRIIETEEITFNSPKEPADAFSFTMQIKTYSY